MRRASTLVVAAAATAGFWMAGLAPASAEMVQLSAELNGANVDPPVLPSAATGTGTFEGTLDTETRELTYTVTFDGLLGQFAGAHFHAEPGPQHPNQGFPAVLPIRGSRTSPIEGTVTLTPGQMEELLNGDWHVNVKTTTFNAGQMQGQVVRAD